MSTIHFIGGEKGGVGKSVVARVVAQYAIDRAIPFVAVDADGSHGALLRFYADHSRAVDLGAFESADQIMTLATEADRRVLVDLPAQSDRVLAAWIAEAGVLELARESGVGVVFWHVMDDGKDSVLTLDRLMKRHGASARYAVVLNHGRGKDFSLFEQSPTHATALALGAAVIALPELHAAAMAKIDRFDASFWAAVNNPAVGGAAVGGAAVGGDALTRMDRQRVKVWLETAFDRLTTAGIV